MFLSFFNPCFKNVVQRECLVLFLYIVFASMNALLHPKNAIYFKKLVKKKLFLCIVQSAFVLFANLQGF